MDYAAELKIWVVLGSCRKVTASDKTRNCLYVISPTGAVAAPYDKRELYGKDGEVYSPGEIPVILTINGIKCGFLVCFDSCFPALYASYRNNGVQFLFHSYYNARNNGAANSLEKHVAGMVIHDLPDRNLGWTYDNRKD